MNDFETYRPDRLYVAGPMTYYPQFNFPAFDAAANALRDAGFEVISPAELDDPEDRARAMASPDGAPMHYTYGKTHADFLARDLKIIADRIDAIVVLPGWSKSTGARIETFIGFAYGKPILKMRTITSAGGDEVSLDKVGLLELARGWLLKQDISFHSEHRS